MPTPPRTVRLLAVSAVVVGALTLAACSGGSSAPSGSGGTTAAAPSSHVTVVIRDFMFKPGRIDVTPGGSVRVVNEDQVTHTLTADGGRFTTGDVAPGASVTVTAPTKTGTYPYRCSIHQYMTGSLVVAQ